MGAGYGTFKSGIGIAGMGTFRPELMMKVRKGIAGAEGGNVICLRTGSTCVFIFMAIDEIVDLTKTILINIWDVSSLVHAVSI